LGNRGIVVLLWMLYSYQSRGFPDSVLESNQLITVTRNRENISFIPTGNKRITGFIFYPGGMVDPKSYAPLARRLAGNGFAVHIVKLPLGSARLSGQETDVMDNTRQIMDANQFIQRWVLGGHSRDAAIASRFASHNNGLLPGLILIGTSHPKDDKFDLSNRGNHSQFGYFGTLLGDGRAEISREEQQEMTVSAILSKLNNVDQ
jgi:pimeloyl-ACP methyl ester carboxylesterase